ncbi:lasso peptide biosynthesis PqqD family chaperone [Neobacillus vireti]|uniref:lasso peptide biosynthesis PqqD family chaperone n=1 Tax=Neobacillus vireti TaxID=220686 RepID=UPI002FFD5F53
MVKTTKYISLESTVSLRPGNLVSDMDGEKVMLSIKNGKYYNLGGVGGDIWEQLEKPVLVSNIIKNLMSKYNVVQNVCEEQVLSFLLLLEEEQLIDSRI